MNPSQILFASLTNTQWCLTCRGKLAVEIVYMGLFWAENNSNTYSKHRTTLDVLPGDYVGSVNVSLPSILTDRGALPN